MKKQGYIIVTADALGRLERAVNEKMELGYVPFGNIVKRSWTYPDSDAGGTEYSQPMILKEQP